MARIKQFMKINGRNVKSGTKNGKAWGLVKVYVEEGGRKKRPTTIWVDNIAEMDVRTNDLMIGEIHESNWYWTQYETKSGEQKWTVDVSVHASLIPADKRAIGDDVKDETPEGFSRIVDEDIPF